MTLNNLRELENTRAKLKELEQQYEAARREPNGNAHARDLELRSLKGLINQLKEEIVRCEAHVADRARPASP
jgi:peptidoglycan hydrolase CwlO-like protein